MPGSCEAALATVRYLGRARINGRTGNDRPGGSDAEEADQKDTEILARLTRIEAILAEMTGPKS